jgi:integrase
VDTHLAKMRKKNRSERSTGTFIHETNKYLAQWLDRPIAELTGAKLVELHQQIKDRAAKRIGTNPANDKGAPLANRVIAHVSAAWRSLNKKLEGKLGSWNPASAVDKDTIKPKRERIMDEDLPDYAARVATMRSPIKRDGLMFALFTGLRNEDVRTMRFQNVEWDDQTLHLPNPKGGEGAAFTIPLSATPMAILLRRQRDNANELARDDEGWCFPGIDMAGKVGPIADLRQSTTVRRNDGKRRSDGRFPVEDVHSLRRTWESIANDEGISELDQHVLSNHSFGSHNVNATYISQHIDHLATCADKIDAGITRRIKGAPTKKRKTRRGPMRLVS